LPNKTKTTKSLSSSYHHQSCLIAPHFVSVLAADGGAKSGNFNILCTVVNSSGRCSSGKWWRELTASQS